ncbi:MAG: hypothetical protein OD811_05770 [Alphaproteobacteria bacterium]
MNNTLAKTHPNLDSRPNPRKEQLRAAKRLLVCPFTRSPLEWRGDLAISARARMAFVCEDNVIVLRRESARDLYE